MSQVTERPAEIDECVDYARVIVSVVACKRKSILLSHIIGCTSVVNLLIN